jgi:hypothetical protein
MYFDIDDGSGEGLQVADVPPILEALDRQIAKHLNIRP